MDVWFTMKEGKKENWWDWKQSVWWIGWVWLDCDSLDMWDIKRWPWLDQMLWSNRDRKNWMGRQRKKWWSLSVFDVPSV